MLIETTSTVSTALQLKDNTGQFLEPKQWYFYNEKYYPGAEIKPQLQKQLFYSKLYIHIDPWLTFR